MLHEKYYYDDIEGCMRWRARDTDRYVYFDSRGRVRRHKPRVCDNQMAGARVPGAYSIAVEGDTRNGLHMIWSSIGAVPWGFRVATIEPKEMVYKLENLYLAPMRRHYEYRYRARNLAVVSYDYACRHYTVVAVDANYDKTVLSYHKTVESALVAPRRVDFL